VASVPFLAAKGLDTDRLTAMNTRLAEVGPAAWELGRLLGAPKVDADAAGAQVSRIDQVVQTLEGLIAEYEPRLKEVRERTDELRSRSLWWITPGALLLSAVLFWIALSQLSLMAHAWSWLTH
jgi:hypothetical protein